MLASLVVSANSGDTNGRTNATTSRMDQNLRNIHGLKHGIQMSHKLSLCHQINWLQRHASPFPAWKASSMKIALLAGSAICLIASAMQSGPPGVVPDPPLSNTFISAAEMVLDDAGKVEIKAPDDRFESEMRDLKSAKDNLDHMAYEDREHRIVSAASELVFAISACHIQAKDGADTAKCESQIENARNRAMYVLGKHKSGTSWIDGPPA